MPLRDYSTKAAFDADYDIPVAGVRLACVRTAVMPMMRARAPQLVRALDLRDGQRIALIGVALGWSVEALSALLPGATVVGTDISPWVQTAKDETETADYRAAIAAAGLDPDAEGAALLAMFDDGGTRARVPIIDEDSLSPRSRKAVEQVAGGSFDWVISDDMIGGLTDDEALALGKALAGYGAPVAHIVTPLWPEKAGRGEQDTTNYNRKLVSDWKALGDANGLAGQRWIDVRNFAVT